jgi:hypothetical protein
MLVNSDWGEQRFSPSHVRKLSRTIFWPQIFVAASDMHHCKEHSLQVSHSGLVHALFWFKLLHRAIHDQRPLPGSLKMESILMNQAVFRWILMIL